MNTLQPFLTQLSMLLKLYILGEEEYETLT